MEFNSRKFSNTALAICMRVLICVCAVGLLGYRASAGSGASSSATAILRNCILRDRRGGVVGCLAYESNYSFVHRGGFSGGLRSS